MKNYITAGLLMMSLLTASSCGDSKKQKEGTLGDQKVELQKLKSEKEKLDAKIATLQKNIALKDTSAATQKPKLVSLSTLEKSDFKHYLDLQGRVDNQNVSYITPSGQPGQVKAIYVKQGDAIRKGQLILKLDNSVAVQSVNGVRQQMASVRAQLDLAKSVYNRQKNLWDQHIGTEVQLLQAKTNVASLEGQLRAIQANVNTAQQQANLANVYSDVNGSVDEVTVHVGETFNGNPMQGGYIKVVNKNDLKITVTVPENYAGKISKGTPVEIQIPDISKSFSSNISFVSQSIGTTTRGLTAEAKVPSGINLRPNQIALVRILDYSAPHAISAPLNVIQTDESGKYVLVASKEGNRMVARKRKVEIGQLYGDKIEIKQGLNEGDQIITEGYQGLFDGQAITAAS